MQAKVQKCRVQTTINRADVSEYRFHLQKYSYGSKISCPNCGKSRCFVRYVDDEGIIRFPDTVGKCDHENSCGYHYTPREYFHDHPDTLQAGNQGLQKPFLPIVKNSTHVPPTFIYPKVVERSLADYGRNPLYRYLCGVFGEAETTRLFSLYKVGTSNKWGGSTVFWQTDISGKVRTGKIMLYDSATGHRVKEPHAYVGWAHSELRLTNFHLRQCLFGEHLLNTSDNALVMLVESEKTAIIMSHFIPDYIWLATGGKNGCFNSEAMHVLRGRDVTLVPDLGAAVRWKEKARMLSGICKSVTVSDMLEQIATEEQRKQGLDIADFFLFSPTKRQMLQLMIEKNPAVQLLIDEFGLELVE